MPADGVIQIAFDRYLLPSTAIRQSVALLDGNDNPLAQDLAPLVEYDPIARTITLSNPRAPAPWLTIGQLYKVELGIPQQGSELGGVRAIDGATLDPNQERRIAFFVGAAANKPPEPPIRFCRDVLPIFAHKCNSIGCHGSLPGDPFAVAAGLHLQTSDAVRATAIGRVAQGASTNGPSAPPEVTNRVFGINMAIVKPGDPGNSWLLYKVELAPPPVIDTGVNPLTICGGPPVGPAPAPYAPLAPARLVADSLEREILSDYVLGREMPYPRFPVPQSSEEQALTFTERETLRLWIAQGAEVQQCEGCGVPNTLDGGP
jgi:hypothetical protein